MDGTNWQATIAWRGNAYVGWQRQPNGVSVQLLVERAIGALCGTGPVPVVASGRTDSSVHAEAQIISFRIPVPRPVRGLIEGVNHHLPDDIAIISAQPAPDGFCPRRWARRKLYRYRILNRPGRCPFRRHLSWHLRRELDVEAMQAAAVHLVGRHDFSSFRAARCMAASAVRTVHSVSVSATDDGEVRLEFVGNGFLSHQVRIMTGTLVDVGVGTRRSESIPDVLAARSRDAAGRTAPGHGLTLVWVELGDGPLV